MTDHISMRYGDLARQFFAREGWTAGWDEPIPRSGLPAVYAQHGDPPFRAHLGYLLLESHYYGHKAKTGLFFRYDYIRYPDAIGPLMSDEQEFFDWARDEHPNRVAVIGDQWAEIPSVIQQAFRMPWWREKHPDIAAEADNLQLLMELGA